MSEFSWNDELVLQFAKVYRGDSSHQIGNWERDLMERFKAVKQPKQEWNVLSIRGKSSGNIYKPSGNGLWLDKNGCGFAWSPEDPDDCSIHSVKRLSDGEVFTVGDWVRDKIGNGLQITMFKTTGSELYVKMNCASGPFWTYPLSDLSKMLQGPLPVYLTPSEIEKLKTLLK